MGDDKSGATLLRSESSRPVEGAARVRCYVLAMRSRSTLQPGDAYAPMAASPQHRDLIRELDDRIGPFPPLDGTE